MPLVTRAGKPTLHYELDDYTDPWRNAPYLILQHGYGRSGKFWYSWVPYLSRFYRVVRRDLRRAGPLLRRVARRDPRDGAGRRASGQAPHAESGRRPRPDQPRHAEDLRLRPSH